MIDDYPDPAERDLLQEEDELVAALVGEYIARCEQGAVVLVDELLARAEEFGQRARTNLEDLIVLWEVNRLSS